MKTIKQIFSIDSIERLLFTLKVKVLNSFEIQTNRQNSMLMQQHPFHFFLLVLIKNKQPFLTFS